MASKKLTKSDVLAIAAAVECSALANTEAPRDTIEWHAEYNGTVESVLDGLTGRYWDCWAPRQLTASEVARVRKVLVSA